MRKAIVIVPSDTELSPDAEADLVQVAGIIVSRTIIVRTPDSIGEAVAIADTIVTSLFLVRDHEIVTIIAPACGVAKAFVSKRDEKNCIAKLEPMLLDPVERRGVMNGTVKGMQPSKHPDIHTGPVGAIGDPLFTTRTDGCGAPLVMVTGVSGPMKVFEHRDFEPSVWRMDREVPPGQIGGGVWTIGGAFVGLTLARKMPYENVPGSMARERFFALPAEDVMDFAEARE